MVVACHGQFDYLIIFSNSVFQYLVFPTHMTNQLNLGRDPIFFPEILKADK